MILPHSEQLLEQLEWIAEDIIQRDGDAYVLPVTELSEAEEEAIRRRMSDERQGEYRELREAADVLARRLARADVQSLQPLERSQLGRELAAIRRRFAGTFGRDYFASSEGSATQLVIEQVHSATLSLKALSPPADAKPRDARSTPSHSSRRPPSPIKRSRD